MQQRGEQGVHAENQGSECPQQFAALHDTGLGPTVPHKLLNHEQDSAHTNGCNGIRVPAAL